MNPHLEAAAKASYEFRQAEIQRLYPGLIGYTPWEEAPEEDRDCELRMVAAQANAMREVPVTDGMVDAWCNSKWISTPAKEQRLRDNCACDWRALLGAIVEGGE